MPLEIAQHAEDRDSQRQELEQIGRLIKGNLYFFSGICCGFEIFWDACPSVKNHEGE